MCLFLQFLDVSDDDDPNEDELDGSDTSDDHESDNSDHEEDELNVHTHDAKDDNHLHDVQSSDLVTDETHTYSGGRMLGRRSIQMELPYEGFTALDNLAGTESRGLSVFTVSSSPSMSYKIKLQSGQDGIIEL
ncbi:uncharacterized protein LOC135148531 [Daucus carota subsp. sativus]|uniref:uncharacterized protein LOC135148531 n=1 Tax=Daucus carota subsp. sativus TaxID=79200 RepID=UPI0030838A8B